MQADKNLRGEHSFNKIFNFHILNSILKIVTISYYKLTGSGLTATTATSSTISSPPTLRSLLWSTTQLPEMMACSLMSSGRWVTINFLSCFYKKIFNHERWWWGGEGILIFFRCRKNSNSRIIRNKSSRQVYLYSITKRRDLVGNPPTWVENRWQLE